MKKFLPILTVAACLFAGGAHAADNIAFIDIQEVFKRFYKTLLAEDQIRQQSADIKMEQESMAAELKEMKEEVEVLRTDARDETLSEEVRENKLNLLEEKLIEMQEQDQDIIEYVKLRQQQLQQQHTRMSRKLFDEIHVAVNDFAEGKGFKAVIDSSAQSRIGTQVVLYVDAKTDITAEVLQVLNEGHEEMVTDEPIINAE